MNKQNLPEISITDLNTDRFDGTCGRDSWRGGRGEYFGGGGGETQVVVAVAVAARVQWEDGVYYLLGKWWKEDKMKWDCGGYWEGVYYLLVDQWG